LINIELLIPLYQFYNIKKEENMNKQVKHTINLVLAAIALAMGVAVIVLSIIDETVSTNDLIKLLGVAVIALGLLALNKEEEKNKKTE